MTLAGIESVGGTASAFVTIGTVLGEALALYVGYGLLTDVTESAVESIRGEKA
ncbi:DUF7512 family protein [Haladaptatus sp. NG-WS-4]